MWQYDLAEPLGYHATFRLSHDRVIATDPASRRRVARIFLHHGGPHRLLAFRLADTHAHAIVLCSRARAGAFARTTTTAMRKVLRIGLPFEPARLRPIADQRHLESAFRYVLRQEQHHGSELDPCHDASSLPDLLGLRAIDPRPLDLLRAALPRLRTETLVAFLGVPWTDDPPFEPRALHEAAAAAFALPRIAGRDASSVAARHAAVAAAGKLVRASVLADLVGMSTTTVHRLRASPCSRSHVQAVLAQMKLLALVASGRRR